MALIGTFDGWPACFQANPSILVQLIGSTTRVRMPVKQSAARAPRCAVRQWIAMELGATIRF
jgi:hypothetical protein